MHREMAISRLVVSVVRLIVLAAIAIFVDRVTTLQWSWAYLVAAFGSACFALAYFRRRVGLPIRPQHKQHERPGDGLHFAAGITAARLGTEFDKVLLLGLAGATSAGIYAAAYRLVNLAVAPVISFVNVILSSLFQRAANFQQRHIADRSILLTSVALIYGGGVGTTIWISLPLFIQRIFGAEFIGILEGLLPLAMLPLAMSCRLVSEQAVAALEFFKLRSSLQWGIAIAATLANIGMIPVYGWIATAWVLLVGESMLALCYLNIILYARRRKDTL